MNDDVDPESTLPGIVNLLAGARAAGATWETIRIAFNEASKEVVHMGVAEPFAAREISPEAAADAVAMPLEQWITKHGRRHYNLYDRLQRDAARQKYGRARKKYGRMLT